MPKDSFHQSENVFVLFILFKKSKTNYKKMKQKICERFYQPMAKILLLKKMV